MLRVSLFISRLAKVFFAFSQGDTRQEKAEKVEKGQRQNVILLYNKKAGQYETEKAEKLLKRWER